MISPEWIRHTERTAKKAHVCTECQKTIEPGSKYRDVCGVWEGDFSTYRQCLRCANIMDALEAECELHDDGPCFGEVIAYLRRRNEDKTIFRILDIEEKNKKQP